MIWLDNYFIHLSTNEIYVLWHYDYKPHIVHIYKY